jgi:hypothetical protein
MSRIRTGLAGFAALALAATMMVGCGGAMPVGAGPAAFLGTQSPGDVWSYTFDGATFTASNDTLQHTYAGTVLDLPSGFKKLTVTNSNDGNVAPGSVGYAIDLPGVALLVKPAGDRDTVKPIIATSIGSDPTTNVLNVNWITVPHAGWDCTTEEAFGTAVFTKGPDNWSGDITHFLLDGTPGSANGHGTFTCTDGHLVVDGGTAQGALTPAGMAFIDNGPGMGGLVGVPVPAQDVNWADFASHQFRGLMLQSGKTECVWVQPKGDGDLRGGGYQNDAGIESNTTNQDPQSGVTIHLVAQPNHGVLRATVTSHDGVDQVVLMVSKINGKYVGFALGGNPVDGAFNVLLMQID